MQIPYLSRPQDPTKLALGPVSLVDCLVFCLYLAPALLTQVGLFHTSLYVLQALPFLLVKLPAAFLYEHLFVPVHQQSPFVQRASLFEDFVIRCVRYAFSGIPTSIGRVFLSEKVALPFVQHRLRRRGYRRPFPFQAIPTKAGEPKGLWVVRHPEEEHDMVIYYVHGGGFTMGSPFFYLEFFMTWLSMLTEAGCENPAIFALDYTLVPDASFPVQLRETVDGYVFAVKAASDSRRVCVSGDSAGGTLMLSLLLRIADQSGDQIPGLRAGFSLPKPQLALLISPWTKPVSGNHVNNSSDYLDSHRLRQFGMQFAGAQISPTHPLVSPGDCNDSRRWKEASPEKGFLIIYGQEEIFAPDVRELMRTWRKAGIDVTCYVKPGGVHAWVIVSLFLASTDDERFRGLKYLVNTIRERILGAKGAGKQA